MAARSQRGYSEVSRDLADLVSDHTGGGPWDRALGGAL
jgi:hypothetical protein